MASEAAIHQIVAQILSTAITAQNSCPVHEQCDDSCPSRVGVRRYYEDGQGNRSDETDRRLNAAIMAERTGQQQQVPGAPVTINPDMPVFRHVPLAQPARTIRLLRMNKQAYFRADPVDCELVHCDIGQLPPFGALSYVWGTEAADRRMLCNGAVFYSKPRLEAALKKLRAGFAVASALRPGDVPPQGNREEYLWADAICIDQSNEAEKAAQIQLMERIFAVASTVYVDLGNMGLEQLNVDGLTIGFGNMGGMGRQDTLSGSAEADFPLHYKTAILALGQPWFSRTWVIQEMVLARRVRFMTAGNVFTQEQFDAFFTRDALRREPDRVQEIMADQRSARGLLNYQKIMQIKEGFLNRTQNSLQYMMLSKDFAATEPKDKVFGLLALMREDDKMALGDYASTVDVVFRRFAALHVIRKQGLQLLDLAGLQRRKGAVPERLLPSWVPDWTAQASNAGPRAISTLRPQPYAASGSITGSMDFVPGTAGLKVEGLILDKIESVIELGDLRTPVGRLAAHTRIRSAFDKLIGHKKLLGRSKTKSVYLNPEDALARCLLMDDTYTGQNAIASSSPIPNPASTYQAALRTWKEGKEGRPDGRKMDAVDTFTMQTDTACYMRSFATTSNGYIGLIPTVAKPGDVVALVFGAPVLFILRSTQAGPQPGYFLVGDAYVEGFMKGEATRDRTQRGSLIIY